jgi:hypothetical protein
VALPSGHGAALTIASKVTLSQPFSRSTGCYGCGDRFLTSCRKISSSGCGGIGQRRHHLRAPQLALT